MLKVTGYAKSVVGGREANQDSYLIWNERSVYAVADGVGGGLRGEVASKMAADGVKLLPDGSRDLNKLFNEIQAAVLKEALESIGEALMGTTLTAVLVDGSEAQLCHVGDSRLYLFDGQALQSMTVDHEIFDDSIGGPVLASYMGIPTDVHPLTIQEETFAVAAGNRLLLCSDGLYKQVEESRMAEVIRTLGHTPEALLDTLCSEAAATPYSDNVTVIYVTLD